MGLCSYYRSFVPDFSAIAAPLHEQTKKPTVRVERSMQRAFEALKEKIITAPILALPRDDCQYILDIDASDVAVGAVLSQVQDGEERVIAYYSAKYSDPEKTTVPPGKSRSPWSRRCANSDRTCLAENSCCEPTTAPFNGCIERPHQSVNKVAGWLNSRSSTSKLNTDHPTVLGTRGLVHDWIASTRETFSSC